MSRPKGLIYAGSSTERLLDRLITDGSWLATSMLADFLPELSDNTLHQTLQRLRTKGWIESRPLHEYVDRQTEHEWRVHPDFEWPE